MTLRTRIATIARAAARAPMIHFTAIGSALFIIYAVLDPGPRQAAPGARITVPPKSAEMFVEDEVLYREAVSLGLHRADPIVRRRLIQKMRFLLEDTAPVAEPSDAELARYLTDHADRFRVPASYDIQHIFFSRDRRADPVADAAAALTQLADGATVAGDGFALGDRLRGRSPKQLERTFGPRFAKEIESLAVDRWSGPVKSSFGVHLVRVEKKGAGRVPRLSEIRARVRTALMRERRATKVRQAIEVMRARYRIEHTES